jgi:hypothetical protein
LGAKRTCRNGCRVFIGLEQRHLFLVIGRGLHLPAAVQGDADVHSWRKTRKHMLDLSWGLFAALHVSAYYVVDDSSTGTRCHKCGRC